MFYCSDTLPLHHTLFFDVYSKLSPLKNFEVYNLTKSFYIGFIVYDDQTDLCKLCFSAYAVETVNTAIFSVLKWDTSIVFLGKAS